MMEGKTFASFDAFRAEFWKSVARSKYAGEFGGIDMQRMQSGLAPLAPLEQRMAGRVVYELHHQVPISRGGSVMDASNLVISTPKYHVEILSRDFHFGR